MRYYFIVGEASGDMYGADLMKNLIKKFLKGYLVCMIFMLLLWIKLSN